MSNREIALEIIKKFENEHQGQRYVFLDNGCNVTNVIFTGASQYFYSMVSWYYTYTNYNWLYLNPSNPLFNGRYDDISLEIITKTKSDHYNLIGISYGAAAAIYFSKVLPTRVVVSIDYANIFNLESWNLKEILENNKAIFFIHYSSHPHDLARQDILFDLLKKTNIMYFAQCSHHPVHSSNIPNACRILKYISFGESLNDDEIIMKNVSNVEGLFLPWT